MHLDAATPAGNLALDRLRAGLGVVGGLGGAPFLRRAAAVGVGGPAPLHGHRPVEARTAR